MAWKAVVGFKCAAAASVTRNFPDKLLDPIGTTYYIVVQWVTASGGWCHVADRTAYRFACVDLGCEFWHAEARGQKHESPASLRDRVVGGVEDVPPHLIAERPQTFTKDRISFALSEARNVFEHHGAWVHRPNHS